VFVLAYLLDDGLAPGSLRLAGSAPWREQPLGYCKLRRHHAIDCVAADRPVELQRMYVAQAAMGRGFGSQLIGEALRRAREFEHDWIWLCSWDLNDDANRFYRRFGFREHGERPFVLGTQTQRDLVLARALFDPSESRSPAAQG
jgi:ribosomal protein S18 acetylase RimI-like enzyme